MEKESLRLFKKKQRENNFSLHLQELPQEKQLNQLSVNLLGIILCKRSPSSQRERAKVEVIREIWYLKRVQIELSMMKKTLSTINNSHPRALPTR
jgi:hypothetical protein